MRTYGLPGPFEYDYARLLRERYGIEHHNLGCVVTDSDVSYLHTYNAGVDVSTLSAERRFAHDVFEECAADARKAWEERRFAETRQTDWQRCIC